MCSSDLVVFDLGGGTFDVSVLEITSEIEDEGGESCVCEVIDRKSVV